MFEIVPARNRRRSFLLVAVFGSIFLGSCATMNSRDRLPAAPTLAQIKEMVSQGKDDDAILGDLLSSRGVYYLSGRDVLDLHEARVSLKVLDYMLSTPQLYPSRSAPRFRQSDDTSKTPNHGDAHFQGKAAP